MYVHYIIMIISRSYSKIPVSFLSPVKVPVTIPIQISDQLSGHVPVPDPDFSLGNVVIQVFCHDALNKMGQVAESIRAISLYH